MRNLHSRLWPLATDLRMAVLVVLSSVSSLASALPVPIDTDTEIDASTPTAAYQVNPGATLMGLGATLTSASVNGGRLVLQGGAVVGAPVTALDLTQGTANLTNVSVQAGDTALRLQTDSTATATGGSLMGGVIGATLASDTLLTLERTQVVGSGVTGIYMGGAGLRSTGGSIYGGEYGIVVEGLTPSDRATLDLVGTHVEGGSGPAISVGYPGNQARADITLGNGATLRGGNGVLVEIADGSEATLDVTHSTLEGNLSVGDGARFAIALGRGASLLGDVIASDTAAASLAMTDGATFTGRLQHVNDLSLANGATWVLTEDATQKNLALDGGVVRLGDGAAYRTLTVENLSGAGGQFDLRTDFSTGQTDRVEVTGTSSGSHVLNVASSGSDAGQTRIEVARTADGGANFALLNGRVDLGAWSYQLISDDGKSWYLEGDDRTVSPGTASALALFNSAPTVWYGELSTLRARMGELRWRSATPGAWVRSYGNQYNAQAASGVGYQQQQQGLSLGADAPLPWGDGQWLGGVLAGYSQSDLDLQRGTDGTVKSYYAGAYATWLGADNGYYFDALAKINRFHNEANVALSDGNRSDGRYSNLGVGGSLEFGRHLGLQAGWFVEPYAQLSTLVVQGQRYHLDNGLAVHGDHSHSLQGKLGTTLGRTLDLGKDRSVQPYVRAALAQEFSRNNEVSVNGNRFNHHLAGARAEFGVGAAVNFGSRLQAHAGFDYANGDSLEQPWGINAGLRYNW